MKRRGLVAGACQFILATCFVCGLANGQQSAAASSDASAPEPAAPVHVPATVNVVLATALGNITLALEVERAPISSNNFLRYVDQKRLDGTDFYRAVAVGEGGQYGLIQGGLHGIVKREFKPIAHEPTTVTGLSHTDGAVSMARRDPGTATSDFFIIVGGLTSLDAKADGSDPGYAVFGHVVDGMDVVHAILAQPTSPTAGEGDMKGQMLAPPVKIITARRAPQG